MHIQNKSSNVYQKIALFLSIKGYFVMLAGVCLEEKTGDSESGGFVDQLFDEGEAAVFGEESDFGFFF